MQGRNSQRSDELIRGSLGFHQVNAIFLGGNTDLVLDETDLTSHGLIGPTSSFLT